MAEAPTARPAAPRGGAVRFCWRREDEYGRNVTMSLRARDCPDVYKTRELIADLTGCETWVDTVRSV